MAGKYQITVTPVIIFTHLLFIAVTTLLLIWLLKFREGIAFNSSNKFKIFNLHPLFMVIGFVLVGGEAIITYKASPAAHKRSVIVKVTHLILHLIALAAGILGIVTIFKFKDDRGFDDMYSLHSWLGMIAICSFGLQYILGFFTYFFPRAEMSARASLLPWHRFIGIAIFLLAVCTSLTGFVEHSQFLNLKHQQEALIVNFTALLLFLFAFSVSLCVILSRHY